MEKIRITKTFNFEMAHALYGYDGACRNIHGHSYKLHVTLLGKVIHDKNHSANGMVIDFSHVKKIVREKVIEPFDHSLMINGESPHADLFDRQDQFERVILADFQPTSENLLVEMVRRIKPELPPDVSLHHVKLWETESSYAEWYAEDNPA